jgi:hypothetical protein
MKDSRDQWQHKATQRGERERAQRTQHARLRAERERATHALKAMQARLRQLEAQRHGLATRPKVAVVSWALQRFLVARIGFRAVSRVLTLLALALSITSAPCPQTILNWLLRLSIVRIESARRLRGLPLSQAPFSHGLIWMIDLSIGLGAGKIWGVLAIEAPSHHLFNGAPSLAHGHCLGVSVAAAWTGATLAEGLKRLSAQLGRPAAYRKDGGSDRHTAVDLLAAQGLASPCIDDIAPAAAGMRKRSDQNPPAFERFLSAGGRVSGKLQQTLLACVAPPPVRTKARLMHVHRLVTWAERRLQLSPAGGAKAGSLWARLRAGLDELPTCTDLLKRFRADAQGLLEGQKLLKTTGLSPDTQTHCEPRIEAMPSAALRREFRAYLAIQLDTAQTLGLAHVGLPISSDSIASLCGVAKPHGVGHTQDAARMALRLPALCGVPTREEAEQGLTGRVARQQAMTGQVISLPTQRREVLGHPERLESLSRNQGKPPVELIPRPKNRSNHDTIVNISTGCDNPYGPQLVCRDDLVLIENTGPLDMRKAALTWLIQKSVNG